MKNKSRQIASASIILLMSSSLLAGNGKKEIPKAVKDSFAAHYPNVKAEWEKEGNSYEAEFEIGEVDMSVEFDSLGNTLLTETEIEVSALPQIVREHVNTTYKTEIKEAFKIVDNKGTVTYEVEIKKKELVYDATGNFLKEDKD